MFVPFGAALSEFLLLISVLLPWYIYTFVMLSYGLTIMGFIQCHHCCVVCGVCKFCLFLHQLILLYILQPNLFNPYLTCVNILCYRSCIACFISNVPQPVKTGYVGVPSITLFTNLAIKCFIKHLPNLNL